MAKKTYVALSEIRGLEAPKPNKDGTTVEHVLPGGAEYSMDEADAEPFVAGGSLVLKSAKTEPKE